MASNGRAPWRARWALAGFALFCVLPIPGPTGKVGRTFVHNLGDIFGVDSDAVELSPTTPPTLELPRP